MCTLGLISRRTLVCTMRPANPGIGQTLKGGSYFVRPGILLPVLTRCAVVAVRGYRDHPYRISDFAAWLILDSA